MGRGLSRRRVRWKLECPPLRCAPPRPPPPGPAFSSLPSRAGGGCGWWTCRAAVAHTSLSPGPADPFVSRSGEGRRAGAATAGAQTPALSVTSPASATTELGLEKPADRVQHGAGREGEAAGLRGCVEGAWKDRLAATRLCE